MDHLRNYADEFHNGPTYVASDCPWSDCKHISTIALSLQNVDFVAADLNTAIMEIAVFIGIHVDKIDHLLYYCTLGRKRPVRPWRAWSRRVRWRVDKEAVRILRQFDCTRAKV